MRPLTELETDQLLAELESTLDMRGNHKQNFNMYFEYDTETYYYHVKPMDKEDILVISQVDVDLVWALKFNVALLIKFYANKRGWIKK